MEWFIGIQGISWCIFLVFALMMFLLGIVERQE